MTDEELYTEAHRLYRYCPISGLLTRRIPVLNRHGTAHNMPNTKVGDVVGSFSSRGYLQVRINSKKYLAHRIIWLMQSGSFPKEQIDHINGVKTDNRIANLRDATQAENARNRGLQSNNKTGFKGVFTNSVSRINPYTSHIQSNGKIIFLGTFPTPELAHEAYRAASAKYHGEFGRFS
jgi:hypothetical protein